MDPSSMLTPPSPNAEKRIRKQLFKGKEEVARDVEHLKDWLSKQPHLPRVDDILLERFLYGCKYSLERAKQVIDLHFTVKSAVPEFFQVRDPSTEDVRRNSQVSLFAILPKLTPEGYRVAVSNVIEPDVNKCDVVVKCKRIFMVIDVVLRSENILGAIIILDMKSTSWGHFLKVPLTLMKKFTMCLMDALPIRVKALHIINSPGYITNVLEIIKPLIKKKLYDRIHLHSNDLDSLYQSVPSNILPVEYGGKEKSLKELSDSWQLFLESQRDWFIDEESKRVDESKRPGKPLEYGHLFGMEGSFRKLAID